MKKVNVFVEFSNKEEKVVYAILFTGVMSRKYLYLQRISDTGHDDPNLIRITLKNTKGVNHEVDSIYKVTWRNIIVADNVGLNDKRIEIFEEFEPDIMKQLKDRVKECECV